MRKGALKGGVVVHGSDQGAPEPHFLQARKGEEEVFEKIHHRFPFKQLSISVTSVKPSSYWGVTSTLGRRDPSQQGYEQVESTGGYMAWLVRLARAAWA